MPANHASPPSGQPAASATASPAAIAKDLAARGSAGVLARPFPQCGKGRCACLPLLARQIPPCRLR